MKVTCDGAVRFIRLASMVVWWYGPATSVLSNVTSGQIKQASGIAKVVCVQNHYNLVHRDDDALIDELAGSGVAYVPFFPLGGFTPLQ